MRRVSHLGDLHNRRASDLQGLAEAVQAITSAHVVEYQTPLTGFSITPANTTNTLILEPAGALLAGTVTMPASPVNGQPFTLVSTAAITALTTSANAGQTILGALTTIAADGASSWVYRLANTTWYRTG